jgi:hypothetical protein
MKYDGEGKLADIRDLTDEEYDATYQHGSGGHELPPEVLAQLNDDGVTDDG